MPRQFNTAGPNVAADHYTLPPLEDPADAVMAGSRLYELLHRWAAKARPLVLIIDEIDCFQDDGLISVLSQPRADVRWSRPDGGLDIEVVRHEFVEFWREHAEPFVMRESYREVAVQLIVMACLQRIVNGGGYIFREYAAGSGRIDVLIRWPLDGNLRGGLCENHLFEPKAWSERHKKRDPRDQGLEQVAQYAARVPLASATLVIADRRTIAQELAWEDRVRVEAERPQVSGLELTVIRV